MQNNLVSFREHLELGEVAWLRDFERGLGAASEQGKPILLLFQEVPGCSTCVNFGQDVLAHPLMVELIEGHFIPVAIFNNHPGKDAEILRRFGESSWNNPVVRFLGPDGAELVPKLADRSDALGLHEKITAVLEALGNDVPGYFRLLGRDLLVETGLAENAVYTTPCFWSGETSLAQYPAVVTTEAGWTERKWFGWISTRAWPHAPSWMAMPEPRGLLRSKAVFFSPTASHNSIFASTLPVICL